MRGLFLFFFPSALRCAESQGRGGVAVRRQEVSHGDLGIEGSTLGFPSVRR